MARSRLAFGGLRPDRLFRRLVDLLGPTGDAARQSLIALVFNSSTSFVAGAMLLGFDSTWTRLPPLLVLVPAAIGLRGNVFSTLGNRLSTSIHTGTFRVSFKSDSVLTQNLLASFALTMLMSVVLAVAAKVIAVGVGISHTISVLDITVISVLGGLLGSLVVAVATVLLTMGAVRYEWDLDNLVAPSVSTLGDVITIPALWLAAQLVGHGLGTPILGGVLVVLTAAMTVWAWQSRHAILRQVFRESTPVLFVALILSAFAGVVLQKQEHFLESVVPAIFVLQPAFVSSAGALGGILCGRVATNLHLGSVDATLVPGAAARRDMGLMFGLAVPMLLFNTGGAVLTASLSGSSEPGFWWLLTTASIASVVTMVFVGGVAYYSTIGAWRLNVDPDSYGVPIVTASVDFVGTMALVFTVVTLGFH